MPEPFEHTKREFESIQSASVLNVNAENFVIIDGEETLEVNPNNCACNFF